METLLLAGIGLILLGALLIVVEAFVPSGGVIGLAAAACAVAGVVVLFRHDAMWGTTGLLCVVVLGPMVFFWAVKMLPYTPMGKHIMGDSGEDIAARRSVEESRWREARSALEGKEGTAATDLVPAGVVVIDGARHDAIARGGLIDKGARVRVTRVDGMEIEVREIA
jgi:membrane-bound ClpP family serine protease